ncbi:MFS transporter [Desulfitobacterium metallireducens]|uniref:MFS transporter n=1 Tax=Desulfitobacterium metallireducens DSM 15288 TaxID=871968 RepID=W0E792_9FIRM|nr:MFS transporter [Desulfitobacterium metallireducens]AHF06715.1 MFS transporter [Desulfitobacterium metallireducens DSM 15288]
MNDLTLKSQFFKAFPALAHAPFRWFWCGQIISVIGTWTQNIGQAWLVLELTNSPFLLGLVSAMQFLPMLLLSLHAGAWIDRISKRHIIILTQTILMILAFALALLVGTGLIRYWMLLILALILGVANTVDVPARQSFVIELAGREDLTNAIALNSAIFNGGRIVGPAIAGIIMGAWGPMWCFIINGISFIGVIGILRFLPSIPQKTKSVSKQGKVWPEIKEGLSYIHKTPTILLCIALLGFMSAIAMNTNVLVPILAKMKLNQQALGYGLLMSAMGFGALVGALTVAVRSGSKPRWGTLYTGATGLAVSSILLGLQSNYGAAVIMLVFMGWSMITFSASVNSMIQLTVADEFRGRVMSVYSLVFGGMTPFGSLYAGTLAHIWGAGVTFIVSGILSLLFLVGIGFQLKRHKGELR